MVALGAFSARGIGPWLFGAFLLALPFALLPARAADSGAALKPETLRFLWSRHAFLHVNANDVGAAFKVLAETVGRRRGYMVTTTIAVGDATTLASAVRRGEFELLIVDSWTYLAMDIGSAATPRFVSSEAGTVGKQYLLLARQEDGPRQVEELRSKELTLYEVANVSLGRAWLDTLLAAGGLGTHETFLGRVTSVGKPSAAVLPVFFGTKPACLVDRAGFEVMRELNPQVGKALRVLAASDVLVDGFICLRNSPWASETFKRDLEDTLAELHREPAGQQILALVKASQLAPFEAVHLEPVKKLRAARDQARRDAKPGT